MFIGHSMTDKKNIRKIIETDGAKIYFIGIGGVSMSALAELCISLGLRVFGSDRRKSEITQSLIKKGAIITYSHAKTDIHRIMPSLIVYSLAIDPSNPEYRAAIELGITAISRAEFMGAIIDKYKKSIGVSGSHGKSTVTAMLYSIFNKANKRPTVIAGAEIVPKSSYVSGEDELLIYESCEYGDSFLHFSPSVQILLNLDLDHTDYFSSLEDIKESFLLSANLARTVCIINADDENLNSLIDKIDVPVLSFSKNEGSTFKYIPKYSGEGRYDFDLYWGKEFYGSFSLGAVGEFNVTNAAAAVIAAITMNIPKEITASALADFHGISRRLEMLGKYMEAVVFYDYAHHPREICAVRETLSLMGYNNICAIFAPHTYTRTKAFFSSFAEELSRFSVSFITDIYGARECAITGITSSALAETVRALKGRCAAIDRVDINELLEKESFDCLVLMGAGDLENIKNQIQAKNG